MSNALNLTVRFNALDSLSGALKNMIGLGRTGDQALRGMKREARDLNAELKSVGRSIAAGTGNVTELIEREKALGAAIENNTRLIERQKRVNVIDGQVARIRGRGEELKSTGQQNMIAGAGMLTPFVLAGKAAMDFSSGMVDIQQKAELSNAETAGMARNLIAAAQAAHQMPEAMRAGVDTLAGLGMDPRNAIQMIGPIGRLGTAFKVELADGAQTAYANLNNLKVPLGQVSKALDIMAAGGNAGAFEIKDMARYFPGLTAQAQALGQSGLGAVADLTAALQIARRATGTADEAGTNVQNLLAKINSTAVSNAFQKKFGVDLPAALKQAYAQGKTPMEALAEVTNKALGGDLSKIGQVVEDMQAQSALRALILNMEDYRKIRAQIAGASSGTVDRAFSQRQLQDASVAWTSFKGTVSALAITLGTTLLPVATQFFGHLNTGIGVISAWAQANPHAAQSLMSLVAAFAVGKLGLGVLQYAFGSLLGPMASVWGAWQKYKQLGSIAATFPRIAKSFAVLRAAALFLGRGMMQAGLMMLANPMVLAIVAIGAAIGVTAYLVYRNWDRIKGAFAGGVAGVTALFNRLPNWGRAVLQAIDVFGIGALIFRNWDAIASAVRGGISTVTRIYANLPPWAKMLIAALNPLAAVATIAGHWTEISGAVRAGVGKVSAVLSNLPPWATWILASVVPGGVGPLIAAGWNAITGAHSSGSRNLVAILSNLPIGRILINALIPGSIATLIPAAWADITARFNAGVTWVKGALAGMPGWMSWLGSAMMNGLLAAISPAAFAGRLVSMAQGGVAAFKARLGIKSPSRVFMALGGHLTEGLGMGVDRGARRPIGAVGRMAALVAAAGTMSLPGLAPVAAASALAGSDQRPGLTAREPLAAPRPVSFAREPLNPRADRQTARAGAASNKYEIHIHQQAGESSDALMERLKRMLDERDRRDRGSSYQDDF